MMTKMSTEIPDSTAVRVALWRALHVQLDSPPHVLNDEVGLKLVSPEEDWRSRPDMNPDWTGPFRASIVARSRFVEDLLVQEMTNGVNQYVILGAGLDTFAQRKPKEASSLQIFEIDKPDTQAWKRQRLLDLGEGVSKGLHFVPVDFEAGQSWWEQLVACGFDTQKPAIVTSLGVSMYLTLDAIKETLQTMTLLAPGSKFIMTFLLPLDQVEAPDRPGYEMSMKGAKASGTPFISLFSPDEMLSLAREAGFQKAEHLSITSLIPKYFANRPDGLRPSSGEEFLIATT